MVGQDHDRLDGERPRGVRNAERRPQIVDAIDQQGAPPFQQVHCEEIGAARHPHATVTGHAANIAHRLGSVHQPMAQRRVGRFLSAQVSNSAARVKTRPTSTKFVGRVLTRLTRVTSTKFVGRVLTRLTRVGRAPITAHHNPANNKARNLRCGLCALWAINQLRSEGRFTD